MMLPIVDAVAEAINTKVEEVRPVGFNDKSVNTLGQKSRNVKRAEIRQTRKLLLNIFIRP